MFGRSAPIHSHHASSVSPHIHHSTGRCCLIPATQNTTSRSGTWTGYQGQPPHQ